MDENNINNEKNEEFWDVPDSEKGKALVSPEDPGEKDAKSCKLFGILSLCFVFPLVFCIISLMKYNKYQKTGDGSHQEDANVGRICSRISIGIQCILALVGVAFVILGLFVR